ncbi:hypothetical protein M0R45_004960 [Rubus argutus]|uniref:Multidrug and toxic compound extrusion protein n=1 Tax=Rubus argutus TaxID=59490 RepID=A0AAW1YLC3_RUBAR
MSKDSDRLVLEERNIEYMRFSTFRFKFCFGTSTFSWDDQMTHAYSSFENPKLLWVRRRRGEGSGSSRSIGSTGNVDWKSSGGVSSGSAGNNGGAEMIVVMIFASRLARKRRRRRGHGGSERGVIGQISRVCGCRELKQKFHCLAEYSASAVRLEREHHVVELSDEDEQLLGRRVWIESKKLWHIVGPAIFSRVASYCMFVITQAFAGHLGDLELAAISIASNVIVGFDFGLLLGMASALETLCGQAFGAKKYYMLGVYMQRSWIVLFLCCILLLPLYLFASPFLKLLGQPTDVAELCGLVAMAMIPLHFSFAFQFPLQRFLQSQLKTGVIAWVSLAALIVHIFVSWFFVCRLELGVIGTAITLNFSCVFWSLGFIKLSAASGVMLCLETWYYRILVLMTGNLQNAKIAVDALAICMTINGGDDDSSGFLRCNWGEGCK